MNVHSGGLLQLETTIRTPENLESTYALAGTGSRAASYLIDCFILIVASQLGINLLIGLTALPLGPEWAAAIAGLIAFVIFNGYFIFFEWLLSGQTPGKRLVGIRVIKVGGYSLRFLDVLLRNLMRFVDFLPVFYGVGAASLLMTSRCQRLGDLVAGTLVVYQDPRLGRSAVADCSRLSRRAGVAGRTTVGCPQQDRGFGGRVRDSPRSTGPALSSTDRRRAER